LDDLKPVFIADSCIGGLSVLKAMWKNGNLGDAIFMADYAINPLGVKDDSAIAGVVSRWLKTAEADADTLIIACNTLSIRYHQLALSNAPVSDLSSIVSMVDCFMEMVKIEAPRLVNRNILIIGTEFTASQSLYPDILSAALPIKRISTIAATDLERQIARLEHWNSRADAVLAPALVQAIEQAEVVVLACTCFPMVRLQLEAMFPDLVFLDPGTYCADLIRDENTGQNRKLSIRVSGDVVSKEQVAEFARSYLYTDSQVS
jgi:glutamate racemase